MNRPFAMCIWALVALNLVVSAQAPPTRATGDQRRQYVFAPTGQQIPCRASPENLGWEGVAADHPDAARRRRKRRHVSGSGRWLADEARRAARLHRRLAAGVHAARRLWQSSSASGGVRADSGGRLATCRCHAGASARAQPERTRGDDRVGDRHRGIRRRSLAHPPRRPLDGQRRRVAPGGPVSRAVARGCADVGAVRRRGDVSVRSDQATADLHDRGHRRDPFLEGTAHGALHARARFRVRYLEVDGNHGGMVPMVWPRIFEFFNRQGQAPTPPPRATAPGHLV